MTKNQYLDEIVLHLKERYGAAKAENLILSARNHFDAICVENADEPAAYDTHTKQRIYPAIASLKAMTESGIPREEAIDFLCNYYRWRAEGKAAVLKKAMKIPGLYKLMPVFLSEPPTNRHVFRCGGRGSLSRSDGQ